MMTTVSALAGVCSRRGFRILFAVISLFVAASGAAAQDRPYGFSFSPEASEREGSVVFVTPGYADSAPRLAGRAGLEAGFGAETLVAGRLSLLSNVSVGETRGGSLTALRTEALYHILRGSGAYHLVAGTGYVREVDGTSVWLGRVVGERTSSSTRVVADVRFEHPFRSGRDAVDVLMSLGALRRAGPSLWLGAEAVGEDLEGLLDADEAEGGARILVGPTLHFTRPESRWHVTLSGGPVFHRRTNGRQSAALRDLHGGSAIRLSFGYTF